MATAAHAAVPGISAREAEVLDALGEHLSNAEIATRLFISVRTVESHVSSLLRKLQVEDRRALAGVARARTVPAQRTDPRSLPVPVSSFVGRSAERAALATALDQHRLVTAVGPGGIGKTRLALTVVADVGARYGDGTWFVDLVPVTDDGAVSSAVAAAVGLGEQQGRAPEDALAGWCASRQALLVLDNCEHVLAGAVTVVERLLAASPHLTVLATSRARLLTPAEWVFPVPGLSLDVVGIGPADAVMLFLDRAAAAGADVAPADLPRVRDLCRSVDGMALAIELAAARLPSVGLDGLEAGLADRLSLLVGGPRRDERHRSLRSALDWSYGLLDDNARAVLRRVAVFAAPFRADAAASLLAAWPPVAPGAVPATLAALAEQSLLTAVAAAGGTRYRVPETIRQYGLERMTAAEAEEASVRHLQECLRLAAALPPAEAGSRWRVAVDAVADDVRAALRWALGAPDRRVQARELALAWAAIEFLRGWPSESQRWYEAAATVATDSYDEAMALRHAAGAAESRHFGDQALALTRRSAEVSRRGGDVVRAARDLARAAERMYRTPGMMATTPSLDTAAELLAEAWLLAHDDAATQARILVAEAFRAGSYDPLSAELAERAVALAERVGDPLIRSAALDELTSVHLAQGDLQAALRAALHRLATLAPVPLGAISAMEHADALAMAAECALAAGDLPAARTLAEQVRDLPFHREDGHLANARLLVVAVLVGQLDEAVLLAEQYREGWERAGRPRAGNLSRGAYAAATAYGLRGNDDERERWLRIVAAVATPGLGLSGTYVGEFFDALLELHRGRPDAALDRLAAPPENVRTWHGGMWRPWYAALWAEAAVLVGAADAARRLQRARVMTIGNPVATLMVERAAALAAGDRSGLLRTAAGLEAAGCRYQAARTRLLVGGVEAARAGAELAAIGATSAPRSPG